MQDHTKRLLRAIGYNVAVDRVERARCAFCDTPIRLEDFKDQKDLDEYNISGLCQTCQDLMFLDKDDDDSTDIDATTPP